MADERNEPDEDGTASTGERRVALPSPRTGRGLEFDRIANFSDAVYAIALTLIAVELHPPVLDLPSDPSELLHALGDMADELIIFFVAFAVMGSYWLANHRFVGRLRGADRAYTVWVLPYLAFVAFLPFPSALMARYFENPVAVAVFAVTMSMVSVLECVLLWRAHVGDLFIRPLTPAAFRWAVLASLAPVAVFLLSIPVMWIDTTLAVVLWLLNAPIGALLNRRAPAEALAALG